MNYAVSIVFRSTVLAFTFERYFHLFLVASVNLFRLRCPSFTD